MVDRQAKRRAHFILATIATTDRSSLVIKDGKALLQQIADFLRFLWVPIFTKKRENSYLDWRQSRVEAQHNPLLVVLHVFMIGVEQCDEQNAIDTGRRLDHIRF